VNESSPLANGPTVALPEVVCPTAGCLEDAFDAGPLVPFSDEVIDLLATVSAVLLKDPVSRQFPDVATFGFWCRRSSVRGMQQSHTPLGTRVGRGLVFHIAPGNVPVNFAYSLVAGMLAGNANIVRLPSASFRQVDMICAAFDGALASPEHASLRDHVRLIRYGREDAATTRLLSARCDVRVVWGGDESISEIRRSALPARAFDVTFADRYSLCVIDADAYLEREDTSSVAEGFYNDTYLFDQNACTAPHLVVWLGGRDAVERAKKRFWHALHQVVERRYELATVSAVDKRASAYRFAALHEGCRIEPADDNLITRVSAATLEPGIESWRSACGYFTEFHAAQLADIVPVITGRYQTLSYLGVDPDVLRELVVYHRMPGIDRIVPVGRTLDFSLDWDGYDLVCSLSRVIAVT
jgi:hypothetical protein